MKLHPVVAFLVSALMLSILALSGCGTRRDALLSPIITEKAGERPAAQVPSEVLDELTELRRIAGAGDRGVALLAGEDITAPVSTPPVVVPAGSVDALDAAIASAGPNGRVILQSGLHTEHSTVAITQRVAIIGETDAVLQSGVTHSNLIPTVVRPALYVHGAEGVMIWNVTFAPTGTVGGTAILIENAPRATIGWNSFRDFQYSILLQNSHASTVIGNSVVANAGWLTGDPSECDGIININGSDVRIADNDVAGGLLNVFCSGRDGFYLSNTAHDGFVGMILCKVPDGSFLLPSGAVVGSEASASNWMVQGNTDSGNFYSGLLVIDGANNNHLVNNGGSGNGAYDIELLGTTCLFGFQTPTSFNNTVVVGAHQNLTINDFGEGNKILGPVTVTHNVSAPCAEGAVVGHRFIR